MIIQWIASIGYVLRGDKTANHIISESRKPAQKEYKPTHER